MIYYHINPMIIVSSNKQRARDKGKFQARENFKGHEDLKGQEALFQDEPGNTTHE